MLRLYIFLKSPFFFVLSCSPLLFFRYLSQKNNKKLNLQKVSFNFFRFLCYLKNSANNYFKDSDSSIANDKALVFERKNRYKFITQLLRNEFEIRIKIKNIIKVLI